MLLGKYLRNGISTMETQNNYYITHFLLSKTQEPKAKGKCGGLKFKYFLKLNLNEEQVLKFEVNVFRESGVGEFEEEETWKTLIKYFFHGILFSGLFLVLGIIWAVILAVLIVIGLFIGFIIGIIVLFFIIGGLNVLLTGSIWNISVKSDWKSLLAHGFVLFIALLIANIPR
jgi:hypothetical protein